MNLPNQIFSKKLLAWSVHLFTASTGIIALLTIQAISEQKYTLALWLMFSAIFIDAVDGTLARTVDVKTVLPNIDGALLDNILDFLNYVITPCYFLLSVPNILPPTWDIIIVSCICLASCYQFTQIDAKTPDHFFKGFPSYWNIVVFYLYIFNLSHSINLFILLFLCIMVFVPIKYIYPSRLDYFSESDWVRKCMLIATIIYGLTCGLLLLDITQVRPILIIYNISYICFYLAFSLFRTYFPLLKAKLS